MLYMIIIIWNTSCLDVSINILTSSRGIAVRLNQNDRYVVFWTYVSEKAVPIYYRCRPLPYVMSDMVNKELDRLLSEDIIKPVQYSDRDAPFVPMMKTDNSVRLCGHYKLTVNQVKTLDRYPIPWMEDLYAQLGKGGMYTKLDMRHPFEQIELYPDSPKFVTINIPPRPLHVQATAVRYIINNQYQGFPTRHRFSLKGYTKHNGVPRRYLGDGTNWRWTFADTLASARTPCWNQFPPESVKMQFLEWRSRILRSPDRHRMNPLFRYHPLNNPRGPGSNHHHWVMIVPWDDQTLQSFLIQSSDSPGTHAPAAQKAHKGVLEESTTRSFRWNERDAELATGDNKFRLVQSVDPDVWCLSMWHRMVQHGTEKPIAHHSRSLSPAEENYAQIDKDGLAVIDGLEKFHQYL